MQGGVAQADVFVMLPIPLSYRPFAAEKPNHPGQYYGQYNDAGGDGGKMVNDCQQGNYANYDGSICGIVINNAWKNGMGQRVKCPLLGRLWHGVFGGAGCLEWVCDRFIAGDLAVQPHFVESSVQIAVHINNVMPKDAVVAEGNAEFAVVVEF